MIKFSVLRVARRALVCFVLIGGLCSDASVLAQRGRGGRGPAGRPAERWCNGLDDKNIPGVSTDLSGTYSGQISYPARGLEGAATLVVEGGPDGQRFRLTETAGGDTFQGRFIVRTTCKYTAVVLRFDDPLSKSPADSSPAIISLRACNKNPGILLQSSLRDGFSFSSTTQSNPGGEWGSCGRSGWTRGDRPL